MRYVAQHKATQRRGLAVSTDKFHEFAAAVRRNLTEMASAGELFVVAADSDAIWSRYLAAFPPGTDLVFRVRTEHDCSCCRHFVRAVGPVVAVLNGALATVWDVKGLPEPYQSVADALAEYVRELSIRDAWVTKEASYGADRTRGLVGEDVVEFRHFSITTPTSAHSHAPDTVRGDRRTKYELLKRATAELTSEALQTVSDLIADNAIYRGREHARTVDEFRRVHAHINTLTGARRDWALWVASRAPVARFRNTVIGSLADDLSKGVDLEVAVRAFETKVAPENYQRPTALVTKKMVEDASKKVRELGLEDALPRRHARMEDVSVSSVLFVDRAVRGRLRGGGLVEEIMGTAVAENDSFAQVRAKAERISAERFFQDVLPKAESVSVYLTNDLLPNLASITAPVHEGAGRLFKWDNDFAWSYAGGATDTIRERVKRAGGQVEGVALRVSLAWSNYDDLDLHVEDARGEHFFYAHKGNVLDVDMNAGHGTTRSPVENMRWTRSTLRDGIYRFWVNQFLQRERTDPGFEVEIEAGGQLHNFSFSEVMRQGGNVEVATLRINGGALLDISPSKHVTARSSQQERWGLTTERWARVSAVIESPNHWGAEGSGNKHQFFLLEGCKNPEPVRGMYNEFLRPELNAHRKVFEILAEKMKCPPADEQLSGVGFSETLVKEVAVQVTSPRSRRCFLVTFGGSHGHVREGVSPRHAVRLNGGRADDGRPVGTAADGQGRPSVAGRGRPRGARQASRSQRSELC